MSRRSESFLFAALLTVGVSAQQKPGDVTAPPIARPTYELDRGPTIAIDEAHKNTHTISGQFQALARLLRRDGYRVRALTEEVSRQSLDGIDVLVTAQPGGWEGQDASFTAAEVTTLVEWMRAGGSLLLIADHMPAPAGAQRLTTALGIEQWHNGYAAMETPGGPVFNLRFIRSESQSDAAVIPLLGTGVAWQGPGAIVLDHRITAGRDANERVDSVLSFGGSAFQLPAGAEPLLVLPPGAVSLVPAAGTPPATAGTPRVAVGRWHQAAVMALGRGRAALFADAGMFSAQWPVHPAASRNYQLVLNVMRWLAEPVRQFAQPARRIWNGLAVPVIGSLSSDGRHFSYVDPATGDLAVRDFTTGTSRRLTNTGGWTSADGTASSSVLSADGRQVAYIWVSARGHEVRVVPVEGGQPRVVMRAAEGTHYLGVVAWTGDQEQLFLIQMMDDRSSRIGVLRARDGSLRTVKSLGAHYPRGVSLSPDERHLVYDVPAADGMLDLMTIGVDGSGETSLVRDPAEDSGAIWAADRRHIVFFRDRPGAGSVWSIPVNEGRPAGPAQLLQEGTGRVTLLGSAADGALYYATGGPRRNVMIAELDEQLRVIGSPARASARFVDATVTGSWSPDGESLAYYAVRGDPAGSISLVIRSVKSGDERVVPLALKQGPNEGSGPPRWFPDGRSVLVAALDEKSSLPRTAYFRVDVASGGVEWLHAGWSSDFLARNPDLSPDGATLYYAESPIVTELRSWNIFRLDLNSRQRVNLRDWMPKGPVRSMAVSPDGTQFAYLALEENRSGVLEVIPSAGGPARQVVRLTPWFGISTFSTLGWAPDGRHLLFAWSARGEVVDTELYRVPVTGGQPQKVGFALNGRIQHPQMHPGGRKLAFSIQEQWANEIWSIDGPRAR